MRTGSVVRPNSGVHRGQRRLGGFLGFLFRRGGGAAAGDQQRGRIGRLLVDRDAHVVEHRDDGLEDLVVDQLLGQVVVDLLVRQETTRLAHLDERLQLPAALGDLFLGQLRLVQPEFAHQRALPGARHLHAQRLGLRPWRRRPPRPPVHLELGVDVGEVLFDLLPCPPGRRPGLPLAGASALAAGALAAFTGAALAFFLSRPRPAALAAALTVWQERRFLRGHAIPRMVGAVQRRHARLGGIGRASWRSVRRGSPCGEWWRMNPSRRVAGARRCCCHSCRAYKQWIIPNRALIFSAPPQDAHHWHPRRGAAVRSRCAGRRARVHGGIPASTRAPRLRPQGSSVRRSRSAAQGRVRPVGGEPVDQAEGFAVPVLQRGTASHGLRPSWPTSRFPSSSAHSARSSAGRPDGRGAACAGRGGAGAARQPAPGLRLPGPASSSTGSAATEAICPSSWRLSMPRQGVPQRSRQHDEARTALGGGGVDLGLGRSTSWRDSGTACATCCSKASAPNSRT